MMMPPQGFMATQPGAPPMMQPIMGQVMPPIGSIPPQSLGSIPPQSLPHNTSPAHLQGPPGGPHPGPHNQIPNQQSQMPGSQGQIQGQPLPMSGPQQSQIHGLQGHIPGYQMTNQQGHLPSGQGPMPTGQVQIPISNTQPHLPIQGSLPNQPQNHAVAHLTSQIQPSHQMPPLQMIPGAPMSPTSNVPMPHPMMPPMGPAVSQPYQSQPPAPAQEQTAELISFD